MDNEQKIIKLKTEDGKTVEMSKKAADRSEVLKKMILDYPDESELAVNVNYDALSKIKEYLEHYESTEPKEIKKPLQSEDFAKCVDEWDYNYIGKEENIETLKNLILATNFLDIKPLLNLLSAKIGHKIKGINTGTIRTVFGIKDLNEEEKKQFDEDKKILEQQNINN